MVRSGACAHHDGPSKNELVANRMPALISGPLLHPVLEDSNESVCSVPLLTLYYRYWGGGGGGG